VPSADSQQCAARIGQTFSDATDTITIAPNLVEIVPDIERNDRVFSDGVGQISSDVLQRIWKEFRQSRRSHATIVQIRYQGKIDAVLHMRGFILTITPQAPKVSWLSIQS